MLVCCCLLSSLQQTSEVFPPALRLCGYCVSSRPLIGWQGAGLCSSISQENETVRHSSWDGLELCWRSEFSLTSLLNTFPVWIPRWVGKQTFGSWRSSQRGLSEVMKSEHVSASWTPRQMIHWQVRGHACQRACLVPPPDPQLFLFNPPSGTDRPFVITRLSDVTLVLRLKTPPRCWRFYCLTTRSLHEKQTSFISAWKETVY